MSNIDSKKLDRLVNALNGVAAITTEALNAVNGTRDMVGLAEQSNATNVTQNPTTVERAKQLLKLRRFRDSLLGAEHFGEPAWDMLLDLYIARCQGRKIQVSSLCIASMAPPTTALRYISVLTDKGIIIRQPDPTDGRRILIHLSQNVHEAIERILLSDINEMA